MTVQNFFKSSTITGILWGIIGGIGLIIATKLTTSGPKPLLVYVPTLIAPLLSYKFSNKANITFKELFSTGLIAFMVMSLFLYLNIILVENPQNGIMFFGHAWRLLFMLAVGILSSLVVSLFVKKLV